MKNHLYRILKWSEQYTKTDMLYLARGSFWSSTSQVISSIAVFGFAVLVAHLLPKEVYGQYKYIIATVTFIFAFSLTGIGTAVFQSVARSFDGALSSGFWLNIRWSIFAFLGAFMFFIYYFSQGNNTLAFGILIGGSLSPLLMSANLASTFLTAKKDFARDAIYFGTIETLFSIGCLSIAILLTQNPLILVAIYFSSNTIATLLLYFRIQHVYTPDITRTDPDMENHAKHLSVMNILTMVAGSIDQILLFQFVGPVELAIYNFAIAIPDQTKGPLKAFNSMVQAKFVNRTNNEILSGMKNKMVWIFFASTCFIILYIVLAPYFYTFFFPNYTDAIFYSQIYVISLLALASIPADMYLVAKKRIRYQYIQNIILSLFKILSVVIGVMFWGLLGIIIARVASRLFAGLLSYTLYYISVSRAD
ncbi:hypothetical protein COU16_00195 [Candidatus Kaiserbacteria bacterium CG10_big_fil_rev_8_21_14_0_10_47_16]|uniref:Polysaccharide biosynthesis protein C-terminal domain-containing protein n=1 Tax=Candidatus Kaiserbacteria bacterium CG10_big_fil_rev_8_21_14_0_10_47_16 TaxID=1974608 RepID=A0A2H0UGW8_9BACT|nr:MAG: hypothetical protein COU16_00195 [Candidatus Kaiserbacteria bacterium CG10_big_fil_rev_8_21_14_0_10_47_16]